MRETSSQIESRKVVSLGDTVCTIIFARLPCLVVDSSRSLTLASLRPMRNDEPGQIILPPMGRNGSMQGLVSCITCSIRIVVLRIIILKRCRAFRSENSIDGPFVNILDNYRSRLHSSTEFEKANKHKTRHISLFSVVDWNGTLSLHRRLPRVTMPGRMMKTLHRPVSNKLHFEFVRVE
ncbi:hypothetical protein BDR22DRAFT_674143 [Usnea florida]